MIAALALATVALADPTERALTRCATVDASTAGQVACETAAQRSYDARMNRAYAALLRRLPAPAIDRLRRAQRHWLAFRAADAAARDALYATRRGTMYAPMQAADDTAITRDRALQLEARLRVLSIDD